jgi:sugar phosphate isomerase/epimerase
MRLAYSSNAYMKHPIRDAIWRIAAIGYRGVELMADKPHAWPASVTDEDIENIRGDLGEAGIEISNINAFMMNAVQDFWRPSWIEPDTAYRQQRVTHTIDALKMARKLGAKCITTEPGGPLDPGMSRDWAMDTFVEGLNHALKVAEAEEILLLVEPEPDLLIENASQFEELAARVDSPAFGLNFDVGHFYCVSEPLPETVRRLAPFTKHYHFEDIAANRVHQHLVPGDGAIDFKSVVDAIRETGYDGWLTVELYPFLDDPDGAGKRALDRLAPLLLDE